MKAVFPPALAAGDRVGVAALSGPVAAEALAAGVETLQKMGLKPVLAENLASDVGLFAGGDRERLAAFTELASDDDLKAIFFARGGHGILRVLPLLDWRLLEQHPRAYVGYSDVTPFLNLIVDKLGLVAFHGPMVAVECAQGLENVEMDSLWQLLSGDRSFEIPFDGDAGPVRGVLKGGCLSLLAATVGTEFAPHLDDTILFWEDVAEPLYRLDRMLTQLQLSGSLSKIKAMVAGRIEFLDENPPAGGLRTLLKGFGEQTGVPVGWNLASGHCRPNLTLPLGAEVVLDGGAGALRVLG